MKAGEISRLGDFIYLFPSFVVYLILARWSMLFLIIFLIDPGRLMVCGPPGYAQGLCWKTRVF